MLPISVIEEVYRAAKQPIANLHDLVIELCHWHQAFPACNYLQPCVIDGREAIIHQRHLQQTSAAAYQALAAICSEYGIFLKEDARQPGEASPVSVNRRSAAVILTFCLTFSPAVFAAKTISLPLTSSTSSQQMVSLSMQNRTLAEVTGIVTSRSGIQFQLNGGIDGDKLNGTLQAATWPDALAQLLQGYNYSTIQENGHLKTVLVSGYKNGIKPSAAVDQNPTPQADATLASSQASNIFIPLDELVNMPEGGCSFVDLPVGSFDVKQETMVTYEDGTLSWVGIMENKNQFYRLYLAKSQDGELMGNVFAPDGTYYIQTIDGKTVMVPADSASSANP